jgi:hypothetical protein
MPHFYERNIVEIKDEYTTFLVNIMTPFIYEGIKSLYNHAKDIDIQLMEKGKYDPRFKTPGILKIFQACLKEIPGLNNHAIEAETDRIKEKSKCSDWFDDLVKAVIKSNIVLLTFSTSHNKSGLVDDKYHERINIKDFIHKCYIECGSAVYNNPELFWHNYPTLEIKRNQREICHLIKTAIRAAIRRMLPMRLILQEFLKNDYVPDNYRNVSQKVPDSQYMNVKAMVKRDLHGDEKVSSSDGKNLLDNPEMVENIFEEYHKQSEQSEQSYDVDNKLNNIQEKVDDIRIECSEKEIDEEIKKLEKKSFDSRSSSSSSSSSKNIDSIKSGPSKSNNIDTKNINFKEDIQTFLQHPLNNKNARRNNKVSSQMKQIGEEMWKKIKQEQDERQKNNKNISESEKSKYFAKYTQ